METFDVIIVGCGPAGSTAGHILSRSGFSTLMIDKSAFPRRKLCGGGLTNKTLGLLKRVFNETEQSLGKYGITSASSHEYEICFRDRQLVHGVSPFPFLFVDRLVYDDYLLQKAKSAGVTVVENDKVNGLDIENNLVTTASGRICTARFIIGADGAHSTVRKHFPGRNYSSRKWQYNLATALETFIPCSSFGSPINHPVILFGYVDWGYSWIFPSKDKMVVGLGALNRKSGKHLKSIFTNYINEISPRYSINPACGIKIYGHPVPSGNYLKKPCHRNTLLVGDAAGFSDPISGEGIYQAQRSAEIAAMCIKRSVKDSLPVEPLFREHLRRYIYPDLLYARIHRWFLFHAMKHLNFNYFNMLITRGEHKALEIVHGLRTYRFLQKTCGMHGEIV